MFFDGALGSHEAALLVFANTAREARKLGLAAWWSDIEFLDARVQWLRKDFSEEMLMDVPHVVESPKICRECNYWGQDMGAGEVCVDCLALQKEGDI